jgi:hypothetical protein
MRWISLLARLADFFARRSPALLRPLNLRIKAVAQLGEARQRTPGGQLRVRDDALAPLMAGEGKTS